VHFRSSGSIVINQVSDEFLPNQLLIDGLDTVLDQPSIDPTTEGQLLGQIAALLGHAQVKLFPAKLWGPVPFTMCWDTASGTPRCLGYSAPMAKFVGSVLTGEPAIAYFYPSKAGEFFSSVCVSYCRFFLGADLRSPARLHKPAHHRSS
jgi:hypothetical protein